MANLSTKPTGTPNELLFAPGQPSQRVCWFKLSAPLTALCLEIHAINTRLCIRRRLDKLSFA